MHFNGERSVERPARRAFRAERIMAVIALGAVSSVAMNLGAAQANELEQLYAPNGHTVVVGGTNDKFAQAMPHLGGVT